MRNSTKNAMLKIVTPSAPRKQSFCLSSCRMLSFYVPEEKPFFLSACRMPSFYMPEEIIMQHLDWSKLMMT